MIVKFFPYNKDGKRNHLSEIAGQDQLPNEIVKVDLKFVEFDNNGNHKDTPFELWSGFFGLQHNPQSHALKPQIGWLIGKKDEDNKTVQYKFKKENASDDFEGIMLSVKAFLRNCWNWSISDPLISLTL